VDSFKRATSEKKIDLAISSIQFSDEERAILNSEGVHFNVIAIGSRLCTEEVKKN